MIVNLHNDPPRAFLSESERRDYVPTEVATFYDLYSGVDSILRRCMESASHGRQLGWASVGEEGTMAGEC